MPEREALSRTASGRETGPRFSAVGLRFGAGFFFLLLAIPVLIVPHRLAATPYRALAEHPLPAGLVLLAVGGALLAVALVPFHRLVRALADLAGAAAALGIAAGHGQTAGSAGFVAFACLGLGLLLSGGAGAPVVPYAGRPARRVEVLGLVAAATAAGQGLVALGTPAGLAPEWAGLVRPLWLAPLLLVLALILGLAQLAAWPRPLRAVFLVLGGWGLAVYGAVAAFSRGDGPLAVWLVGAGAMVALWPLCGPWFERGGDGTLPSRFTWALTAAVALPLLVAVGAVTDQMERIVAAEGAADRRQEAEEIARGVLDGVEIHRLRALAVAMRSAALELDPARQGAMLAASREEGTDLDTLLLLDGTGRVVAQAGPVLVGEGELRQLAGNAEAQRVHVGETETGQPLVWVSSPVPSAGLGRPGTLVSVIQPKVLTARLARPGLKVALKDGDRRLIAEGGAGARPAADAGAELRAVATLPGLGWMVETASDRPGALAALAQGRELAFLLFLVLLPLAALVAAVVARRLAAPLGQLTEAVEEMAAGPALTALPARPTGEVARLSVAFRELRDRLARRTQESERLADELRARAEALADSDRRKNEFLAMLAHELRNPLGAVSTASYVLAEAKLEERPVARAVAIIQRQVHLLSRLVDDLLDVSRITRGKIELRHEEVDLGRIVAQAIEATAPLAAAKEQTLVPPAYVGPLPFYGDGTRLEQVFSNLIRNAIKFTPAGGRIEVHLTREAEEIRVRVKDDGVGIPADLLPRIFDLFTQGQQGLDRSVGGLGIGLTLARSLVQMHGGSVEVQSEGVGKGAELTVHLPLVPTSVGPTDLDSSAVWAR